MAHHTDRDNRPQAASPQFGGIPRELRALRQWVMWRFDWSEKSGQWAKVPYQPTGEHAKTNDASTWHTFQAVLTAFERKAQKFDGIGFVFSEDTPYCGIDLDGCVIRDEDEFRLSDFALRLLDRVQTYTEFSPSYTGLHLIGKAENFDAFKTNQIEVYTKERYFTFTGCSWQLDALTVNDVNEPVKFVISKLKEQKEREAEAQRQGKQKEYQAKQQQQQTTQNLTVDQLLSVAFRSANGDKIKRLFEGSTFEYGDDQSSADLALCRLLAFYSQGSRDVLDAMFRKSRLMRPKWDEMRGSQTYGAMTLDKALAGQTEFYGMRREQKQASGNTPKPESTPEGRAARRFGVDDLWDSTMAYRKSGGTRGVATGWDDLDLLYRPAHGLLSIVTGMPGSGKSAFVDALTYNIATMHGWVITYASFETLPIERHLLNLCRIHLGKPTFEFAEGCATDEEMEEARIALRPYFRFMFPSEYELDIDSILAYVDDDIREFGVTGFVLDPFTEMEQSRYGSTTQTEMIEGILRKLQLFTRRREIHTWLIAHPTKPSGETYRNGRPTLYSISGSANFYNKADYGVVVHRELEQEGTNTVHIDKVRFDTHGARGAVDFRFEKETGRFSDNSSNTNTFGYDSDDLTDKF